MAEEKKEEKKEEKTEEKKKEEEEVEIPKKFEKLVKEIESLSVLDLAELVKVLEKKFGVSATPQVVASAGAAGAAGAEGGAPEKSSYNIELAGIGDKKIEVIKVVRDITQKGLKEAKDIVDAAASEAQVVKENVKKEEAEEIKKKLEEAGAKVELK
jgi:large subunit ribosomal protein L7/L12